MFPRFFGASGRRKIGPICRCRKIWGTFFANTLSFPGTKIFRKNLSAQLVPRWGGSNGKWSKRFSSANGAKTEQTVRGGAFFLGVPKIRNPDLGDTKWTEAHLVLFTVYLLHELKIPIWTSESEHTATLGRLQWPNCRAHSQVGPLSHCCLIQGDPAPPRRRFGYR